MGLFKDDLKHLVDSIVEIDSYKSKMGEDSDIVTLAFSVMGEAPAKDLENFVEKGYAFVLDADLVNKVTELIKYLLKLNVAKMLQYKY